MTEVSVTDYWNDTTNLLCIFRHDGLSRIVFHNSHDCSRKHAYSIRNYKIPNKVNKSRFFRLTDDEIRDMIIPRII